MDHFHIVATGFRIAGGIIGIPSICLALYFGIAWLQWQAPPPVSPPSPGESQSLITVLMTGARLFSRVAGFFSEFSRAVTALLFILTAALGGLSAGVYFTGRGLEQH